MAATPLPPGFPRVLLANINRGSISTPMASGIINSLSSHRIRTVLFAESGPYLDAGRNNAVANALDVLDEDGNLTWDWLLFVDSDVEFAPGHVDTLFAPTLHPDYDPMACPIISGVYLNPYKDNGIVGEEDDPTDAHVGPVAYEWVERDDLAGELNGTPTFAFRRISKSTLAALPPHPLTSSIYAPICEVACVGAGFMALHHSLLTRMLEEFGQPTPFFCEPIVNGVHLGEDMGFCHRVREMGYPVLVNRDCFLLHHKTVQLV